MQDDTLRACQSEPIVNKTHSTPSHTPGPWRVEADRQGLECVVGPKGVVADTIGSEANARLIAAAPELLDALRRVIVNHCGNSDRIFCGTCSGARKLIARIDEA